MAEEEDKALDLPADAKASNGSKKMLIIIAAIVLVVVISAAAAAFFLLKGSSEGEEGAAVEQTEQTEESDEAPAEKKSALYLPLKPPFVIKAKSSGRQRYLQMELTLVTRDEKKLEELKASLPQLRNAVVTAMASQVLDELLQPEGREVLQQSLLTDLQGLMEEETGDPMIEQVLFTTFVMQ